MNNIKLIVDNESVDFIEFEGVDYPALCKIEDFIDISKGKFVAFVYHENFEIAFFSVGGHFAIYIKEGADTVNKKKLFFFEYFVESAGLVSAITKIIEMSDDCGQH